MVETVFECNCSANSSDIEAAVKRENASRKAYLRWREVYMPLDLAFLSAFLLELLITILGEGPGYIVSSSLNAADTLIVIVSFILTLLATMAVADSAVSVVRLLRLLRLARIGKLLVSYSKLKSILRDKTRLRFQRRVRKPICPTRAFAERARLREPTPPPFAPADDVAWTRLRYLRACVRLRPPPHVNDRRRRLSAPTAPPRC